MITNQLMEHLFPTKGLNPNKFNLVRCREKMIESLNHFLPIYGIDTHKRVSAFLGNCGIETDYFRTTKEYASGWDYDISINPKKARGLGNLAKGDGPKFKGGGLTQTTGKNNYADLNATIGKKLGIDFTKNPERLRNDIDVAVESACHFWKRHNLNKYADAGEFKQLSGIVNRGDKNKIPLHWAKRNELYSKCIRYISKDFSFPVTLPSHKEDAPIQAVTPIIPIEDSPADIQNPKTPAPNDSFVSSAIGHLPTGDVKTAAKTHAPNFFKRLWQMLIRPGALVYGALEAGNVYAWLGVFAFILVIGLLLYWHREDIKSLGKKLKNKLTR